MKRKQLYIDNEALATLGLLQDGLLYPATKLMTEAESNQVNRDKMYNGITFPFSFILAPGGKRNEQILTTTLKDEILDLVCDGNICGNIKVKEIFKINKKDRIKAIFGTENLEHSGAKDAYKRLGNYSICGDFTVDFKDTKEHIDDVQKAIKKTGARKISGMTISAKPFHRVHERLVRSALAHCDLIVLFVLKPCTEGFLCFNTRYKTVKYFCDNFLPKDKVVIIPLENTYIFGGFNELILDATVAKNFGCDKLIVGQNHAGLGAFYNDGELSSILDNIEGIDINIEIMSEFVYCNMCNTLVSTSACPHGHHHHISYRSSSILELLKIGIIPPAILMRKEISAMILSDLLPHRLEKLNQIHQNLFPSTGLLDDFSTNNFYESLMDLYQTSSLT